MFNYLRAEAYRVLRKKSLYVYFLALAAGYFALVLLRAKDVGANTLLTDMESLAALLPAFVGGYLFATLYTDELHSQTLATLIGFGLSKTKIVVCKLLLMAALGAAVFGVVPPFMYAVHAAFGHLAPTAMLGGLYALALKALLAAVAYAALAGAAVYGLQRATLAVVLYVLLALGVVGQLMATLFSWNFVANALPGLAERLMPSITLRIFLGVSTGKLPLGAAAEYAAYVALATLLAALVFRKKELEF